MRDALLVLYRLASIALVSTYTAIDHDEREQTLSACYAHQKLKESDDLGSELFRSSDTLSSRFEHDVGNKLDSGASRLIYVQNAHYLS